MSFLLLCICSLIAAMIICAVLTRYVRELALKRNWVRGPESDRHIHQWAIPRLGGAAIYVTVLILVLIEIAILRALHRHNPDSTRLLLRFLMPGTLMFLTGLADDFWSLRPILKLGAQITSGVWLFFLGCQVSITGLTIHGFDFSPFVSCAATVLWVVMFTNAFNLIDGLDGLAAGASVFPLLTFSAVALFRHNGQMGIASLILTGALLGFLRYNFNPATIFLGDGGSLFIGFMLSALSLAGNQAKAPTLLSVVLPVVACGLPMAETIVSIFRRFLSGRSIFSADREHFHHRLLTLGFTHRQVVILLFAASGVCSLLSVVLLFPNLDVLVVVFLALVLLTGVGVSRLGYPEFAEVGRLVLRMWELKAVIARDVKVRQIATALRGASNWDEVSERIRTGLQNGDFSDFELTVYRKDLHGRASKYKVYGRKVLLRPEQFELRWSIKLEFAADLHIGQLVLQSAFRQQSLMVDVNVLLQTLGPALCNMCRSIELAQNVIRLDEGESAMGRSASAIG